MDIDIKEYLLENLIYFHDFCGRHNLRYYIVGGTLLGAVRHKGFIPWDDDIDVSMPREDYERLLNLSYLFEDPYQLKHHTLDINYDYAFIKLINSNLIVNEGLESDKDIGVWIDIFPIDYISDFKFYSRIHVLTIEVLKKIIILKTKSYKKDKYKKIHIKFFNLFSNCLFFVRKSMVVKMLYVLSTKVRKSNNVINFYGAYSSKEIVNKKFFAERECYEFEGLKFWGTSFSDEYLTHIYGDYMKLPPEEKRVPEHIGRVVKVKK